MTKTTRWFNNCGLYGALVATLSCGFAYPALSGDQPEWVRQLATYDIDAAKGIATDSVGNAYIAGTIWNAQGLVAKYSSAGVLRWQRQLEGSQASGVATDPSGNIYVAGTTILFGSEDAYVAKYSSAGALRWFQHLGAPDAPDWARGVATDAAGNVYIAGLTNRSLGGIYQGAYDAFVAKYSSAGVLRWIEQIGTLDNDWANGVATDSAGNVYIAGFTNGSLVKGVHHADAFVAKYSSTGTFRWVRQLGMPDSYDEANGVSTDRAGNIYIAGQRGDDAFIAKYSSGGTLGWTRQLGTPGPYDVATGVATDAAGNVYITGFTYGSLAGDNQNPDYPDAFVTRYSPTGTLQWVRQLGTASFDYAYGVATYADSSLYIAGETGGSLDGTGQGDDAFIAQYTTAP